MATREQNEGRFDYWEDLPNAGRRYIKEIRGRSGGIARYLKRTWMTKKIPPRVWQEICNSDGRLVAVHVKFPLDTGHKAL
jgi:hypothetical protein